MKITQIHHYFCPIWFYFVCIYMGGYIYIIFLRSLRLGCRHSVSLFLILQHIVHENKDKTHVYPQYSYQNREVSSWYNAIIWRPNSNFVNVAITYFVPPFPASLQEWDEDTTLYLVLRYHIAFSCSVSLVWHSSLGSLFSINLTFIKTMVWILGRMSLSLGLTNTSSSLNSDYIISAQMTQRMLCPF